MNILHLFSWTLFGGLWGSCVYAFKHKNIYKTYMINRMYRKIFNIGFILGAFLGAIRYYCDSPVFQCLYKALTRPESALH